MQATAAQALKIWNLILLLGKEEFQSAYTEDLIVRYLPQYQTYAQANETIEGLEAEYATFSKRFGYQKPVTVAQIKKGQKLEAQLHVTPRDWHTLTCAQAWTAIHFLVQELEQKPKQSVSYEMNSIDKLIAGVEWKIYQSS